MSRQFLLSLDYELFFGTPTGSVENCMIRPTQELARIVKKHGMFLSLFVDALYLQRLVEEARRFPSLQKDADSINRQLVSLKKEGHDVQLHLHPHWLDSSFDGDTWQLETKRYKLHDFSEKEASEIVGSTKKLLTDLVGDTVFAFRAGGWCLQPFPRIAPALLAHSIWLDSTVFPGGLSDDQDRWFDFRPAAQKDYWRFADDPNTENPVGPFVEVPISSMHVTPMLFWRMVFHRKLMPQTHHKTFGDGSSLAWGKGYYLQRLTRSTISVASIDGLKAGLLTKAFNGEQSTGKSIFHAMGHPKALTRYALQQLNEFLTEYDSLSGITFQDFKHMRTNAELPSWE